MVLILVGLIGSGKSTFAEALQRELPSFVRCSQDELGNRKKVEQLARESLAQGRSVCIDRTNMDAQQRSTWIAIARENRVEPWVLYFDTPYDSCQQRIRTRTDHPTITDPAQGLSVLARFRNTYEPPNPREGYTRYLALSPSPSRSSPSSTNPTNAPSPRVHSLPSYTKQDLLAILSVLQSSPPPLNPQTSLDRYFAPRSGPHAHAHSNRGGDHPRARPRGGGRGSPYASRSRGRPTTYDGSGRGRGRGRGGAPYGTPYDRPQESDTGWRRGASIGSRAGAPSRNGAGVV
ncbi:P-loop containing nucleoside triphosphate hydrolase protein [Punctularia strigosozonata HHB-11173 SS5]|uniref:P-loop containing nucleoside triphosphate hydrolase protein n=1 Tax=Punctularia strigosozonata (strain HHB-11173) TaxID=741275 RepID=UPI00044182D5|nr:P-loop containing nucleoside triphosphate hydrolase protein [Punctularia strigosozonata HHB-11173 SS5]EIN06113.1 P-loop containing nucleoside triphosphate hydrolase protein [Punctularia strigosozonata HHB-11173 SS5]